MQRNKQKNLLSIIVPAYKQEKTIREDLENMDKVLTKGLGEEYKHEIICVVDGILDNTEMEAKKANSKNIKVVSYETNMGKGYAVRFGMGQAKGNLVSFLDSGMDISPKGIMMLMAHMEWYNADIIVGSKRHPVSKVNYPILRKVLSVGYHLLVKMLFGLPVTDTQSGIKIFKREVIEKILPRLRVDRYAMDIEMLSVAKVMGFERIYEGPIEVHFDQRTSRVKWSTVFKMAWDTFIVFLRLRVLHYYDRN